MSMSSIHLDMIERKPSNHESWYWELSEIDKVSQPSNQVLSTANFATEVRRCRAEGAALPQQLIWLQD